MRVSIALVMVSLVKSINQNKKVLIFPGFAPIR